MGLSSYNLFVLMHLLFLLSCFHLIMPLCHDEERSALFQFKQSFSINKSASVDPSAYPKVASWKLRRGESNTNDCCSWDGVECDEGSGHVIGLDLSSSLLYGSINSNSSLFRLVHLQMLHLAYNDFNYSQIPSGIGHLSQLTSLNLSYSAFSGQIPLEISMLTQLAFLDLSGNILKLQKPSLTTLVQNLTRISVLSFSNMNMSSQVPDILAHLPSLTTIFLRNCSLHGEFPRGIFHLPKLQILSVRFNQNLTGYLPEFHHIYSNPLKMLWLAGTSFSGKLPDSIGNLRSLNVLDLSECYFSGSLPASLSNLSFLYLLDLSNNKFSGEIPPCLGNISNSLSILNLKGNNLSGTIPQTCSIGSKLKEIDLGQNQLQGQIPRSFENCTMLEFLDLGNNQIEDTFPFWLGTLSELQVLILRSNKFHGAIGSPKTNLKFPKLRIIDLSHNGFTGDLPQEFFRYFDAMKIVDADRVTYYLQANTSFQCLNDSCIFIYEYSMTMTNKGVKLEYEKIINIFTAVDLSSNKFKGQIPECIGNLKGLQLLNLSGNDLIGPIPLSLGNLTNLESLDLSQNRLSGQIPRQLAQLTFLAFFNVSGNNLSGPIPNGEQFDTFQNNSYQGNSGLCGEPLSKKCGISPSVPPLTLEESNDSKFPNEFDWIFIFAGCASGLVVGLVIGHTLTTRYHEWFQNNWFVITFGRRQQKPRRKVGRRN